MSASEKELQHRQFAADNPSDEDEAAHPEAPGTPKSDRGERASAWLSACISPPGNTSSRSSTSRNGLAESQDPYKQHPLPCGSLVCFYDEERHLLVAKQVGRCWELQAVPRAYHHGKFISLKELTDACNEYSTLRRLEKQVNKMMPPAEGPGLSFLPASSIFYVQRRGNKIGFRCYRYFQAYFVNLLAIPAPNEHSVS